MSAFLPRPPDPFPCCCRQTKINAVFRCYQSQRLRPWEPTDNPSSVRWPLDFYYEKNIHFLDLFSLNWFRGMLYPPRPNILPDRSSQPATPGSIQPAPADARPRAACSPVGRRRRWGVLGGRAPAAKPRHPQPSRPPAWVGVLGGNPRRRVAHHAPEHINLKSN